MQPPMLTLLSVAKGTTIVDETIFDSRFSHVPELNRMGANIKLCGKGETAIVEGVPRLYGQAVDAKDLRGGAALIVAALAAEGRTVVRKSKFIERGYEDLEGTLKRIGADIRFIDYYD